jgi:uncharacterized low-complexity protein
MKKVLTLISAMALTLSLATAEGKCENGKCGGADGNKTEAKCGGK